MQQTYIINPSHDVRAIENPNIPLSSPEIWNEVFGDQTTSSGITVNPQKALTIGSVFQAVNLISGDVAKLPLNVYRRRPDLGVKGREVDEVHPAQKLVKYRPNAEMSAFKFWRRLMTHALIWSNAYALIERDALGNPVALLPLLPDRTAPARTRDGVLYYTSEIDGDLHGFAASNILHIEQISITGESDCQMIYKAREAFALALAAEQFASKYFRNGGRIGGILEVPQGMTKQGADNLESGFRKTYDQLDAAFKSVILRDGAKFHQGQFTPEQTQMLGARQEQVKEVARWFNIPPHKLGDDSKASYNSLEQENRAYLNGCLSHWLKTIEAECYLKLLTPAEQQQNSRFIEFNVAALVAADIATQYTIFRTGIEAGILSPDEVRAMQNLNPRPDGLGSKYLRPLNMEYADQEPEPEETPAEMEPAEQIIEESDDDLRATAKTVLDNAVERFTAYLVRKVNREAKQKAAGRFVNWLEVGYQDEVIGLHKEITPAAMVYAGLTKRDATELIESISERLFFGLSTEIEQVLNTADGEQMRAALNTVTKSFKTNVIGYYTEVIK